MVIKVLDKWLRCMGYNPAGFGDGDLFVKDLIDVWVCGGRVVVCRNDRPYYHRVGVIRYGDPELFVKLMELLK